MTEKSVDAFRTISEVAGDLDLPQHVLRFWETRFPQIKPMKRGGGRRYYRPDDVELLKGIQYLLYVKGFTIKGVQRILKENGARFVVAIGSGDIAALEQIQAGRQSAASAGANDEPHLADIDLIAPESREEAGKPAAAAEAPGKPFAGLLKRHRNAGTDEGQRGGLLPRESAEELDDVILQLLECKRLLDQVR